MIGIRSMKRQANIWGWILSIPLVLSIFLFIIYPLVFGVILSFTNWRFLPTDLKFVGFDNYIWIFQEGQMFFKGIWISLQFAVISTLVQTLLGFFLAYILYNMGRRSQAVYKVLLYLPVILPAAVVSVMWDFIYKPEIGLIDRLLAMMGIQNTPLWLTDPAWQMPSIIFTNTWRFVGITLIIYFVAMNAISKEVIESAKIDGANRWRVLWQIMLPLTWNSTKINILLSIIGGMKSFDLFYLMFSKDPNMQVVGLYIFKTAFEYRTFSRAVAMSVLLSIFIGGATFIINFVMKRGDKEI